MIKRWLVSVLVINGVVVHCGFAQEGYAPLNLYPSQWGMNASSGGSDLTNLYGGYPYEAPYVSAPSMSPDPYAQYAASGYYALQNAAPYGYVPMQQYGDVFGPPTFLDQYGYRATDGSSPQYAVTAAPSDAVAERNRPVFRSVDQNFLGYMQESMAYRYDGWSGRPATPYRGQAGYRVPGFGVSELTYPGYPPIREYTASYGGYPPVLHYWPTPAYGSPRWSGEFDDEYVPPPPGDDISYGGFPAGPGYEIWPAWQSGYLNESEISPPSDMPLTLSAMPREPELSEPVLPSTDDDFTNSSATVAPTTLVVSPHATDAPVSNKTVPLPAE